MIFSEKKKIDNKCKPANNQKKKKASILWHLAFFTV